MVISSRTLSVILEIVSLEMEAPYTSWKCAEISPVVKLLANGLIATASVSRRCRFLTITGSKVPDRSLGTEIVTSPAASVSTVLARVPLRTLPFSAAGT